MAALEREIETYNRELSTLLAQQGKYAFIKGSDLVGTFDSYQDALTAGFQKFGLEPFLVKLIAATGHVACFTRALQPCQA